MLQSLKIPGISIIFFNNICLWTLNKNIKFIMHTFKLCILLCSFGPNVRVHKEVIINKLKAADPTMMFGPNFLASK